jgi:hypothetical protein
VKHSKRMFEKSLLTAVPVRDFQSRVHRTKSTKETRTASRLAFNPFQRVSHREAVIFNHGRDDIAVESLSILLKHPHNALELSILWNF